MRELDTKSEQRRCGFPLLCDVSNLLHPRCCHANQRYFFNTVTQSCDETNDVSRNDLTNIVKLQNPIRSIFAMMVNNDV